MIEIFPIPAFADNYIWCLRQPNSEQVVLVDPGDRRVIDTLQRQGLQPMAILITHQHVDHVGAVQALMNQFPQLEVYGPAQATVAEPRFGPEMPIPDLIRHALHEGDRIHVDAIDTEFQVIELPGHTLDHIGYYGAGALFCGDTLFACGCGRIMGGDAECFVDSLQKIRRLPADTQIYCAHEYTLDNIGFARWVEPDNPVLLQRDDDDMAKQEQGTPTVPSSLQLEMNSNPFLRFDQPGVIRAAEQYRGKKLVSAVDVFAAIRDWKDLEYD